MRKREGELLVIVSGRIMKDEVKNETAHHGWAWRDAINNVNNEHCWTICDDIESLTRRPFFFLHLGHDWWDVVRGWNEFTQVKTWIKSSTSSSLHFFLLRLQCDTSHHYHVIKNIFRHRSLLWKYLIEKGWGWLQLHFDEKLMKTSKQNQKQTFRQSNPVFSYVLQLKDNESSSISLIQIKK